MGTPTITIQPSQQSAPASRPTREEVFAAAGRALAEGYRQMLTIPLEEAVDAAWSPSGPSREDLRARIVAYRQGRGLLVPVKGAAA